MLAWPGPNDRWVIAATPAMNAAYDNSEKTSLGAGLGIGWRFWSWNRNTRFPMLFSAMPTAIAVQANCNLEVRRTRKNTGAIGIASARLPTHPSHDVT